MRSLNYPYYLSKKKGVPSPQIQSVGASLVIVKKAINAKALIKLSSYCLSVAKGFSV